MGEQNVNGLDDARRKTFTKALLNDVRALEIMLEEGRFETGIRRIGAEQEMFLVDGSLHAAPLVMQLLEKVKGIVSGSRGTGPGGRWPLGRGSNFRR